MLDIILYILLSGLGSENFNIRQVCHNTFSCLNNEIDLNSFIRYNLKIVKDPEVKFRLQVICDQYYTFGGNVPKISNVKFLSDLDRLEFDPAYYHGVYCYFGDEHLRECTTKYIDKLFERKISRRLIIKIISTALKKENKS